MPIVVSRRDTISITNATKRRLEEERKLDERPRNDRGSVDDPLRRAGGRDPHEDAEHLLPALNFRCYVLRILRQVAPAPEHFRSSSSKVKSPSRG